MKYRAIAYLLLSTVLVGCAKELIEQDINSAAKGRRIEVNMPQMTKTSLGEATETGVNVVWSTGDEIAVIEGKGTAGQKHSVYRLVGNGGTENGVFEYVSGNAVSETITDIVFPASVVGNGFAVPTAQVFKEGSFDPSSMVMSWSRTSENENIILRHDAAALMLTLTGSNDHKVTSVEVTIEDKNYTLNCTRPISLTEEGVVFYIAVPGTENQCKYKFTINTTKGIPMSKSTTAVLEAGKIGRLPSLPFTSLKVGDVYSEGIIFEITDEYAKVFSLDEGNCEWGLKTDRVGTDSNPETGVTNTNLFRSREDIDQFPAAKWCIDKGEGWYMPSRVEIVSFINALSLNTDEGLIAVNKKLTSVSGSIFADDTKRYWSSCEHSTDATKAFPIRLHDKNATAYSKTVARPVRAVKRIDFTKYNSGIEDPDFGEEVKDLPEAGSSEVYSPSLISKSYKPVSLQYKTSKEAKDWKDAKARIVPYLSDFEDYDMAREEYVFSTNKYGSSTDLSRQDATGRFYVTKINDRFWIVDPEGYLHHHRGVAGLRPSKDSKGKDDAAFESKYGNRGKWLSDVQEELASIGFHSSGAFSTVYDDILMHNQNHPDKPIMLSPSFGFLSQFKTKYNLTYCNGSNSTAICLVLDDRWEEFCEDFVSDGDVKKFLKDPNVLGIFSDNEINFSSQSERLLDRVLNSGKTTHLAYKAAKSFMEEKGATTVTDALNQEWVGILAEKYYKGVKQALSKADPKILYLGSRLHGTPKTYGSIIKAADKWCDIISMNYYSRWSVEATGLIKNWAEWAPNTPFLVSEFYTMADDSPLACTSGAGFIVATQKERAYAYQHFALGLLEAKNCVGWHWFKYQDDAPDEYDEPSNKGLYDGNYNLYPWMAEYTKMLNYNVYRLINYFDE